jgi:hypothetical protein
MFAIPSFQRVPARVLEKMEARHGLKPAESPVDSRLREAILRLEKMLVGGKATVRSSVKLGISPTMWLNSTVLGVEITF